VFKLTGGHSESVPLDKEIAIHDCDEFRSDSQQRGRGIRARRASSVNWNCSRLAAVARISSSNAGGRDLSGCAARPGDAHLQMTDVLVMVPGGYPGQPLDARTCHRDALCSAASLARRSRPRFKWAAARGSLSRIIRTRRRCSPVEQGSARVHTYFDEILCWIHRANN